MNRGVAAGIAVTLQELLSLRAQKLPARFLRRMPEHPGQHASPQRSRGLEFAEVRPYQAGDDVRSIDWRQTARRGQPYTRLYHPDRAHSLFLVVDMGPTMRFATRGAYKSVMAARTAAVFAWNALTKGGRVGGMVWGGGSLPPVFPQRQQHGVLAMLGQLAAASQASPVAASTFAESLRETRRQLRPGTQVLILSDFMSLDAALEHELLALAQHADVQLCQVYDIFERAPHAGRYPLSDGEQTFMLDLTDAAVRARHVADFEHRSARLSRLARRMGGQLMLVATDETFQQRPSVLFSQPQHATHL